MCICLSLSLIACKGTEEKKDNAPMVVKVAKAETLTINRQRDFTFISKPFKTSDLSFRVGGPVTGFEVQPGQFYKKGATIAAIDDRDFKIRKEKAEAVFQQADAEYKRISALYEKNNVSGSSYEKAKSDRAIARAAFETAANELEDTGLKAPFDGYIQDINIERFQEVRASQSIVTFIDLSRLKIEAYIPENIAMNLSSASDFAPYNLEFTFDALPQKTFSTDKIDVSKSTTVNNISFLLTAILENKGHNLLGGMTGNLSVTIPAASTPTTVSVPQQAICKRPQTGTYVWILNPRNNQVNTVPVQTGNLTKGNQMEIISGLSADDQVVLSGHSFLSENKIVTIQK